MRALARWLAAAIALVALPVGGFLVWIYVGAGRSNVGELTFGNRLRIPPVLAPTVGSDGRKHFDLHTQTGQSQFLPGKRTETWGVNGAYLGPTLRARQGDTVAINVHNGLPEATTLHWHGMELPAVADGGPHQMIAPGATWSPSWTIDQPAATMWYHPHPHGATARHVYQGVAGMFLVDDPETDKLALPRRYGVDDIPLVIQDKNFRDDGALDFDGIQFGGTHITGLLGDEILVNGTRNPYVEITAKRTRLRLLNASTARVYDLGFSDGRSFAVIGGDSGLLPAPVPARRVRLSPGERVEVVTEFTPGERVVLRSFPPELGANPLYERLAGGDDTFDLLQFRAAATLNDAPPVPATLAKTAPIAAPSGATTRDFTLGDFTINGKTMDMARIDAEVPVGTTEIWRITNGQGVPHNFHVHDAAFRVLDVAGAPPAAWLRGRKDTVYVPPDKTVRVAISFGPHPDPTTPYMFHCHLLAHEDSGMMGQFVIVGPGQRASPRARDQHRHPAGG